VLGGYELARLPFAMALIEVHDVESLIEGLIAIRDAVAEPE
jgi:hypothetical protein